MKTKVKVVSGYSNDFENFCNLHNIYYYKYPNPIKDTYGVESSSEDLFEVQHLILTIKPMPIGRFDI